MFGEQSDLLGAQELTALDLATGEVRVVQLPSTGPASLRTLASGWAPSPDGIALQVLEADVQRPSVDVISIGIYRQAFYRYHLGDDRWERLLPELWLAPAGSTTDGRVVGTLWQGPAYLLGALDLDTTTVWVADDLCLEEDRPVVVLGDRIWWLYRDGEDVTGWSEVLGGPVVAG